ncbi:MAG TPA: Ig-like domain-containing protein [Longimicrobiales bacterium]|jgi:uncharacterized protein YjdB
MSGRAVRLVSLLSLLAFLTTCGGDGGGPTGPAPVASVSVSPPSETILVGGTAQFSATLKDAEGNTLTDRAVTWSTSPTSVATVSGSGLVTGVSAGPATVTATSEGRSGTATVTVENIPVATVEVDAGAGAVLVGETLQLTVTLEDAGGNPLTGRTVTWDSSDDDVATVSGTGLVTGVAPGDVTITATSEGKNGEADIAVSNPSFQPTADTELEGTLTFEVFNIPAGVTVTVTGDLEVTATDELTVAGTLTGDCFNIELRSEVDADITGTVSNACAADPATETPGDLVVAATTDLTLDGATLVTTGDGLATNDESLTDEDFDEEALATAASRQRAASQIGQCIAIGAEFNTNPVQARSGGDSEGTAGSGRNARTWSLNCNGDATLSGGTEVNGQAGGDGGDAENNESDDADGSASGGNGGNGGKLKVQSTGSIVFSNGNGGGTTLNLAPGGNGGSASITATAPGGNATASGGDGGDSGTFRVVAKGGILIDEGGLTINVGDGGAGGDASATAADGLDAGAAAAQNGGTATATGGDGGSTPKGELRATGNVTGLGNVQLTGGDGGLGGDADGIAGAGGDGNQEFPNGADGGNMIVTGGEGGDSRVEVTASPARTPWELGPLLAPVGDGGNGGSAEYAGGWGGEGWDGCSVDPEEAGGDGGAGGDASGNDGKGGEGAAMGAHGGVTIFVATGDGGNGGDGEGPGDGGPGGSQAGITVNGVLADLEDNFKDGNDGDPCAQTVLIVKPRFNSFAETSGVLDIGVYGAVLEDGAQAPVGTLPFEAIGDAGFSFLGLSDPERLGAWFDNLWRIHLIDAVITGIEGGIIDEMEVCVLNTFGEGTVDVIFRDALLDVISVIPITPGPGAVRGPSASADAFGACLNIGPPDGAVIADIVPPGGGDGGMDFYIEALRLVYGG